MRPRPGITLCLAAFLALGLAGCLGGPTRLSYNPTPPDPPPIPLRKPAPPQVQPSLAALSVTRAEAAPVTRADSGASAKITTASLAPVKAEAKILSPPAPATTTAALGMHKVMRGETVYGVSRNYGVPLRSVIDANRLRPPYALRVGQTLRIPKPRKHVVQKGDTVYGVSRNYGVDLTELVRLNRIAAPYKIAPGENLILPAPASGKMLQAAGQPASQTKQVAPLGPATQSTRKAPRSNAQTVRTAPTRATPTRPAAIPAPPPRAGGKFLWPARGRLITGFGPKKGGFHNDGINIAAPRGAPVYSAENGVVAYIGNELRGFGNLILIKHAGGWVTAYAHTQNALVQRGQKIKRGQVIARVGSSGNVSTPQLHFEIRKGARAVNPTRLLGRQSASAG